jgi:hypothetical protein
MRAVRTLHNCAVRHVYSAPDETAQCVTFPAASAIARAAWRLMLAADRTDGGGPRAWNEDVNRHPTRDDPGAHRA